VEFLNSNPLITAKPVVYLLNLSEKNFISKKSKWQRPVYEWVQVRYGHCAYSVAPDRAATTALPGLHARH
jgi:ribosome-binding ATPase YchF (GTP1/OBG family)